MVPPASATTCPLSPVPTWRVPLGGSHHTVPCWPYNCHPSASFFFFFFPSFLHISQRGIKKVPSDPHKERSHKAKFQLFPRINGNNASSMVAGGCSDGTKPHELIASNVPISGSTYPYQREIKGGLLRNKEGR